MAARAGAARAGAGSARAGATRAGAPQAGRYAARAGAARAGATAARGANGTKKSRDALHRTATDKETERTFEFLTNNFDLPPEDIADLYKKRWLIEILFKRVKQNFPLKYFLGDNENAIKIQIWCAFIADLLLKLVQVQLKRKWAFSNLSSIIRLHLMSYINLTDFLNNPEKLSSNIPPNIQLKIRGLECGFIT